MIERFEFRSWYTHAEFNVPLQIEKASYETETQACYI